MTDAPQESQSFVSMEDVQRLVDEQLAKVREEHEDQIAGLQAQLDAARKANSVTTSIPWNSAGIGDAVHETWSYHEQTKAQQAEERAAEERAAKAA